MPYLDITYNFHAVGQGLFSSGRLFYNGALRFHWIYDCGTNSSQALLKRAINDLRELNETRPKLDLAVLSHFDTDHISGLTSLMDSHDIDTLLIPYVPLWQRLILAFEQGLGYSSKLMQFFINPVKYFLDAEGKPRIRRIVMIKGRDQNIPPRNTGEGLSVPDININDDDWQLSIPETAVMSDDQRTELAMLEGSNPTCDLHFIESGSILKLAGLWEFLPYNDLEITKLPDKSFCIIAARLRDALMEGESIKQRNQTLKALKQHYESKFTNGTQRNEISLFLYAGLINVNLLRHIEFNHIYYRKIQSSTNQWVQGDYIHSHDNITINGTHKSNILLTGDGYLNTKKKLQNLTNTLGPNRIKQILCLQVMHHGAEKNWQPGIGKILSPAFSIFCADPARRPTLHPHASVVRDFIDSQIQVVDKNNSFHIHVHYCQPF